MLLVANMVTPIDCVFGKYTKASRERLTAFENALAYLDKNDIPGDVVECGVWQGGHIILARLLSPKRKCWMFDTFDGMTAPGEHDGEKAHSNWNAKNGEKWAAVSVNTVMGNMMDEGVYDPDLIRFIKGDVRKTLRCYDLPEKIALLHLDTDFYDSTKIELEVLWPRIVSSGVMIIDDYGHWPGCKKAVDEYFPMPNGWPLGYEKIDYTAIALHKK